MYSSFLEEKIDAALAEIKKSITDDAANEIADFFVEAEWDDVRKWLTNLDAEHRKGVLLQVMHVLSNAVDAGFIDVVFEQTDWYLDDDDQEETGWERERSEECKSVNVSGTAEPYGRYDDILSFTPTTKRRDGRHVQVLLSPTLASPAR